MNPLVYAEILLVTMGMVGFLIALIGLTAVLSSARQLRVRWVHRALRTLEPTPLPMVVMARSAPASAQAVLVDETPTEPAVDPQWVRLRATMRDATPAPVILSIEPDAGPTRQKRNVQRLIAYLKEESTKPASAVSARS